MDFFTKGCWWIRNKRHLTIRFVHATIINHTVVNRTLMEESCHYYCQVYTHQPRRVGLWYKASLVQALTWEVSALADNSSKVTLAGGSPWTAGEYNNRHHDVLWFKVIDFFHTHHHAQRYEDQFAPAKGSVTADMLPSLTASSVIWARSASFGDFPTSSWRRMIPKEKTSDATGTCGIGICQAFLCHRQSQCLGDVSAANTRLN